MQVNLIFVNPLFLGGQTTFTAHLARGMRSNGGQVRLYKISRTTERKQRDFGYNEQYQNISVAGAKQLAGCSLIVATSPKLCKEADELVAAGFRVVIHDPTHLKQGWNWQAVQRPIIIRPAMLDQLRGSVFLPHPYERSFLSYEEPAGKWAAVSVCRVTSNKHIEMLLDANRLLPSRDHIQIRGAEHAMYVNFWLAPKYPEYQRGTSQYPKEFGYAARELCHQAEFTCDLSVLKGDGGGTQYAFFEAIDGGSCLVLNRNWITPGGVMVPGFNCLAVADGEELAGLIRSFRTSPKVRRQVARIRLNARKILYQHDAKAIAHRWLEELARD